MHVPALQISYTGVLSACGQAGEWRAALRLLKHMREAGVTPNAYNFSAASERGRERRRGGGGGATKTEEESKQRKDK